MGDVLHVYTILTGSRKILLLVYYAEFCHIPHSHAGISMVTLMYKVVEIYRVTFTFVEITHHLFFPPYLMKVILNKFIVTCPFNKLFSISMMEKASSALNSTSNLTIVVPIYTN